MYRRDFVQRLPVIPGLVVGLSPLVTGGCAGIAYTTPRTAPGRLMIDVASLSGDGGLFVQGAGMERPIYVRRTVSGALTALLASCTHRGCQPEPVADRLVCPCHGSEFSLEGEVLEGPAEAPLTSYAVTIENDDIVIWLRDRTEP